MNDLKVIDLICGAGSMTRGFRDAGAEMVAAIEWGRDAQATYCLNQLGRCEAYTVREWIGSQPPGYDVIVSRLQEMHDWFDIMDAVDHVRPPVFLVEGGADHLVSERYAEARTCADSLGYRVAGQVLDAAAYGVPQHRPCSIIVGRLDGDPTEFLPPPTHGPGLRPYRTVRDAIGDLPPPEDEPDPLRCSRFSNSDPRSNIPDSSDPLHWVRSLTPAWAAYYAALPHDGGDRSMVAQNPVPRSWGRRRNCPDMGGRLWWDRPAVTIIADPRPDQGRFIHPEQDRPISAREAARLQGFPDDFVFFGCRSSVLGQIGNSVPIPLVRALAERILSGLKIEHDEARSRILRQIDGSALTGRIMSCLPGESSAA